MLRSRYLPVCVLALVMAIALGGCIKATGGGSDGSADANPDVPAGMPAMYDFYTPT